MKVLSAADLNQAYANQFESYRNQDWAREWRRRYCEQVRMAQEAEWENWRTPEFQAKLWDSNAVASIGPGQSVTVQGAYGDQDLARRLFEARGSLTGVAVEERGSRIQELYDDILSRVHERYAKRRPKARLTRLLAALFPEDMTSIADATRIWGVQRLVSASRVPGDFIAQHPMVRAAIHDAVGPAHTLEDMVDQAIFAWYLWQTHFGKPDEGAVVTQTAQREASAVPPFSLLPANAQRRSLTCVKGNVELLLAIVREAEQGITREDLVGVILGEAIQLNTSSAGNIISQAMGGLGLLRLDGSTYRPTERGHELLTVDNPATVLRGPLIGRVFGMGHLLLMIRANPGALKPSDVARRLQDLVPTWTSTQPGSHICTWARLVGLVDIQGSRGGLVLTDDGEDYAAALPENFEDEWRIASVDEDLLEALDPEIASVSPAVGAASPSYERYGVETIINEGCFLNREDVQAAVDLLRRKKNLILQGPPGTGKTWLAKRLGYALIGARDPGRLTSVQFQPTLSYEDFVRGWRPDGTKGLRLVDGVFLDAVAAANADPGTPYVLVIEEINRGNPAQILGEMLTLIEDGKRSPQEALRLAYPRTINERVFVPENLYLVGTMNLADRSLALVDLALRRRFSFINLSPQFNDHWRRWLLARGAPEGLVAKIAERMGILNAAIESERMLGRQFQVGHSFMTPHVAPGTSEQDWSDWYLETVRTEIAPLLEEYWYDKVDEARSQTEKLKAI
ncbi:ATPase associated with various cellular activities [Neorhizobium galegae bv. officinalis]|uniref:ATPase associated with various cellular activities n=1 Tax=Neorhizobium galegae bv. officinalis TaxID=323656 RepID=A0A0T7FKQ6_NEOGA|nr:AAA family ATPase [Neorhizobium galegae]CDZ35597.1 ATPase associated with various cellular activities [Neorhizobium galegae bv. officinalis]